MNLSQAILLKLTRAFAVLLIFNVSTDQELFGQDLRLIEDSLYQNDRSSLPLAFCKREASLLNTNTYSQNFGGLSYDPDFQFRAIDYYGILHALIIDAGKQYQLQDSTSANGFYSYGMDDSHQFRFDYSDKIGGTYLNILFDRTASIAVIPNNNVKSLNFGVQAKGTANRHNYLFGYSTGTVTLGENGGLDSALAFEESSEINEYSIASSLNSAQTYLRKRRIEGSNYYLISKLIPDSLKSLDSSSRGRHFIFVEAAVQDDQIEYSMGQSDIDSNYYPNVFLSSSETRDSIGFRHFIYQGGYKYSTFSDRSEFMFSYLSKQYDFQTLNQGQINFKVTGSLWGKASLEGSYQVQGRWKGGHHLFFQQQKAFTGRKILTRFYIQYDNNLPSYYTSSYTGNHYQWSNSWSRQQQFDVGIGALVTPLKLRIDVENSNRNNWLYFNELSELQQSIENLNVFKTTIQHYFNAKHFNIHTKAIYQVANNPGIVRLPKFVIKNALSYYFKIGHLNCTLGYYFTYWSAFKGNAYNPALRSTYLQNTQQVGNFPLLDLLAAVRIGEADLFIRWDNVFFYNGRWGEISSFEGNRDYYLFANYPTIPNIIRVGFNWRFAN